MRNYRDVSNKMLLMVGNDRGYFMSHRLPMAMAAAKAGYDTHVAIPLLEGEIAPAISGLTFHSIPLRRSSMNVLRDIVTFFSLWVLYRRLQPNIVHHVTVKPVLYGGWAARLAGVPMVVNAITGLGSLFVADKWHKAMIRSVLINGMKWGSKRRNVNMVFQNEDDRDQFIDLGICTEESSVLIRGSGVDVEKFKPQAEDAGQIVVVLPSRMLWEKGVGDFVDVARQLLKEGVVARFVLVGQTDVNPSSISESQLKEWQNEGIVEWWGRREDMPNVLHRAHVVCLPSKYREGVPKALIEAASAGRPIVTTNMPGCRDIVKDGENGILVTPGDLDMLADALRELLTCPEKREAMGRKGRERVLDFFSMDIVIQHTLRLYENSCE
jgi:glycosyltransferase involved in cell wall biosynthesis